MRRRYEKTLKEGFTLVELLLVVAILGILATVVVVNFTGKQADAMIQATRGSIANIGVAIDMYEVDTGRLPPGLDALIKSAGEPNWNGPYIRGKVPVDAWGIDFQYSSQNSKSYEVRSAGPDKTPGNEDDITSFTN